MTPRLTEQEFAKLQRQLPINIPEKTPPKRKRKKKAKITVGENSVRDTCLDWCKQMRVVAWRNNIGAWKTSKGQWIRYGKVGSGDIMGMTKRGRHMEIETKSTDGEQREDQVAHMLEVRASGGLYIIARSLDDVLEFEKEILNG